MKKESKDVYLLEKQFDDSETWPDLNVKPPEFDVETNIKTKKGE